MTMLKVMAAASFLLATLPNIGSADEASNKKVLNPWTDCGIGAMIFSQYPVAAVISNVIWDLGTTAVTSNVSSQNTCAGKNAKVAQFIGTTYANLEEETVKGDGQHVHAMLNIMGCESAAHSNIIRAVRADFSNAVRDTTYSEQSAQVKAENYYNIVQAKITGNYALQCQAL